MISLEGVLLDRAGQELPLAELAALWPLDGWTSVTPVTGGKNEHLRVAAGDGVHYLRRSYRSKSREELTSQLRLMRLLRERGFPAPEVVPTCSGADQVELSGRLWITTRGVEGTPFEDGSLAHVRALGRTLARYHQIVADQPAAVTEPAVLMELRTRGSEQGVDPALRARTAHLVERLTGLLPRLPRVVVHGGARRGSLIFDGDQVAGVLDFDSAHPDVRVLDLAVAVHDVSKVYTLHGQADHKVALDLVRVAELLAAYSRDVEPTAAEVEALPLLLEAKRLKRGLGRRSRILGGELLSDNDHEKIRLEDQRLAWLDEHRDALAAACRGALAGA
ncbi:phosphotransferase enzyme family protein [Arthrobacter sp. ISL-28]|uniref:phosphotransferase enzyme family protein n=1 Tax=Arthrobacter sp. ISL-28 TaxID=2819108 RepID=UPI001BE8E3D2|nr:phosphotransferase [Arthrobacter sp. ISL-28]MBT2520812.1 phosphotransferase [Arthrobacter sp. ISL-28]